MNVKEQMHDIDKGAESKVTTAIGAAIPDPADLRLNQDFGNELGIKKVMTTVLVQKQNSQAYFRVNPSNDYRLETAVLEVKEDRTTFLVDRKLWTELSGEIIPKVLFTTVNRQGSVSIWPVRLPDSEGRHDAWNASALEAATIAMEHWVRLVPNRSLGMYEVYRAEALRLDPVWPDLTFKELLEIAFKGKFIQDVDHPVVKKLRGEI